MTGGQWNTESASFDSNQMFGKMKELSEKFRSMPNCIVTTKSTLQKLKDALAEKQKGEVDPMSALFSGMPIESYGTVKECLDRMMEKREGWRPKLALAEKIPDELMHHPWLMEQLWKQFFPGGEEE